MGGACPGPLDGKAVQRGEPPVVGHARHARFIFEPEENRLSRSPGDFARVSPNRLGTGPASPETQTGVSVAGREEYGTGLWGGDERE